MVKITPTNNSRLIKRLIANKLIQNLFSYLSYIYPTSQICLPCYLAFISIDNFINYSICFFLAIIFHFLLVSIVLSIIILGFLFTTSIYL